MLVPIILIGAFIFYSQHAVSTWRARTRELDQSLQEVESNEISQLVGGNNGGAGLVQFDDPGGENTHRRFQYRLRNKLLYLPQAPRP